MHQCVVCADKEGEALEEDAADGKDANHLARRERLHDVLAVGRKVEELAGRAGA